MAKDSDFKYVGKKAGDVNLVEIAYQLKRIADLLGGNDGEE